jgi:hypothetical protein
MGTSREVNEASDAKTGKSTLQRDNRPDGTVGGRDAARTIEPAIFEDGVIREPTPTRREEPRQCRVQEKRPRHPWDDARAT